MVNVRSYWSVGINSNHSDYQGDKYMLDAIFSTFVKGGGKTYFFDVKQAKAGNKSRFVQITESRLQDGQSKRNSITIFSEQLQTFVDAFKEAAAKVS